MIALIKIRGLFEKDIYSLSLLIAQIIFPFFGKLSKDGKLLYCLNLMGQPKGSHRDFEYNNPYSIVPVLKYLVDDKTWVTLEYTHQYSQMSVIGSNYSYAPAAYATLPRNFTTAKANLALRKLTTNVCM